MGLFAESLIVAERGAQFAREVAPEVSTLNAQVFKGSLSEVFRHPQKLIDVLPKLAYIFARRGIADASSNLPELSELLTESHPIAGMRVTRYLGTGSNEFTLATESGAALKLGTEPVSRLISNPTFDAPVVGAGHIGANYHFYMQPIGDTAGVTDRHVLNVVSKIRQGGYIEDDMWATQGMRKDQVALFGAKRQPLLIDQGGAVPRYGTVYQNGELVPHIQQQENLSEMTDFLRRRSISLKQWSITNPTQPAGDRGFSNQVLDSVLRDKLICHLTDVGQPPTYLKRWGDTEVDMALRSLTLRH